MPTFVRSQEIEHEIGASGRFALRITSPDAELHATDETIARARVEFEFRAASEEEADALFERVKYQVRESNGLLEVAEPKSGENAIGTIVRMLGMGNAKVDDVRVTAAAPRSAAITFEGVSGDLTVTGFRGTQDYRTVSGDLVLTQLAGDVSVRGVSSDVSLRAEDDLRLEMNTVSGDISAFAPRFDALRVVTVSGDIEIEGDLAAGAEHRVETVSGDLSIGTQSGLTLEVRGLSTEVYVSPAHRSEGSRDRRRYVIGGGEASLLFSSMSGDVSVRGARRGSARAPTPPTPPTLPTPPTAPTPPEVGSRQIGDEEQLAILRALEAGEIDIEEAAERLAGRGDA